MRCIQLHTYKNYSNTNTLIIIIIEEISHEKRLVVSLGNVSWRYGANYKFWVYELRRGNGWVGIKLGGYEILSCLPSLLVCRLLSRAAGASVGLHSPITGSVPGISTNDQTLIDNLYEFHTEIHMNIHIFHLNYWLSGFHVMDIYDYCPKLINVKYIFGSTCFVIRCTQWLFNYY